MPYCFGFDVGSDRDYPLASGRPIFALKIDFCSLARGFAVGIGVNGVPVLHLHRDTEQVGRLSGFDDEEGFAVVHSVQQRRAISTCVDAHRDDRLRRCSVARAVEPLFNVFDVGFASASASCQSQACEGQLTRKRGRPS